MYILYLIRIYIYIAVILSTLKVTWKEMADVSETAKGQSQQLM